MFIYVRETHEAGIRIIAERIKRQLAAQAVTYLDPEGNVIAQKTITVTIGAARIAPHLDLFGAISYEGSIAKAQQAADQALYEGKKSGRNRLVIAKDRRDQEGEASGQE